MLNTILRNAIPLKPEITVKDPMGFGLVLKIKRADATGYQEAEDRAQPANRMLRKIKRSAVQAAAESRGMKRGKGGRFIRSSESEEDDSVVTEMTIADKAPMIAEHLFEIVEIDAEAAKVFGIDDPALGQDEKRLKLVTSEPKDANGLALQLPAAWRGSEEERKPIWHLEDVLPSDDEVPFGGIGAGNPRPTLGSVVASWVLWTSREYNEFGADHVEEAAASIPPMSGGETLSSEEKTSESNGP